MTAVDEAVENAWMRSGARCECRRGCAGHRDRCHRQLVWESRAQEPCLGAWEAHHKTSRAAAVLEATQACEILCWECFRHASSAVPSRNEMKSASVPRTLNS
jgi:uncharacterized radical SAM superfamily Fe-S cluster-containing enzyme